MPNYITYKQADSRWGRKNYNGSSTMATAGCGPTSVAMLAYAVDGKTNPWDVALFMKKNGYAIRNNGTAWSGIPAAMKHFGLKDVKNVSAMADVWSYLSKGYAAVFLFRGGSRGGVTWTTAGHYIAVTGYKHQNGKHYLYTRDSGGRNHTGWYCYETQMKGLIPQIWVGKVPDGKPVKKTPVCIDVSEHQGKINWSKVKKSGINHAIIRAGYGKGNIDAYWKANIEGAIKAGIQYIGVYWFSYAYTNSMAQKEADYLINAIQPYKGKVNLGLWFDYEYDSARYAREHKVNVNRSHVTALHKAFCGRLKEKGYTAGFYYNYDYKRNYIDLSVLPYLNWYALYDTSDKQTDCYLQQYSSKGKVKGISGNVDMNWLFGATPKPKPKPSGKLVVDGKMGVATKKAIQKWVGVKQDGIAGKNTVKALQKKLGVTQDGKWGKNTTKALQKFLNAKGNKLKVDGILGSASVKALQTFLNKEVL